MKGNFMLVFSLVIDVKLNEGTNNQNTPDKSFNTDEFIPNEEVDIFSFKNILVCS
jgi:hypothetical protein